MNYNVGDMPLDIFGDYVSDCLGEEWTWEYIIPILNDRNPAREYGDGPDMDGVTLGNGEFYNYIVSEFPRRALGNGNNIYNRYSGDGDCNLNEGNGHDYEE